MSVSGGLQKKDFSKIKKIHFIGIGGIGLSAIAKLMMEQGKIVSGSDANDSEILEDLRRNGARIFIGQKADNLPDDAELVIYTLAIPESNPERIKAKEKKIAMLTYPEALGILFNGKYGIAICGTHGKSTTTSMVSLVLADAGLDPSVVVGSKVPEFGGNLRVGNSQYFIIEACEYERAFLNYYPKIIILNNIELDHTDYYKDIDDFRNAFEEFIGHLPKDGVLILNGDDKETLNAKRQTLNDKQNTKYKTLSFGFGENNDVRGCDIKIEGGKTKFKANYSGKDLGEFELKLPGKFNVYNALAAITAGLHLGIDTEKIKKSLADFGGIWRRFENKGDYRGATIISDYAHHPTAVRSTIEAAREFYPHTRKSIGINLSINDLSGRKTINSQSYIHKGVGVYPGHRIVAVFQPHQHNRTKMLYQDFLKSFDSADVLILAEIFDVAGREEKKDQDVSSRGMAEDIKKINSKLSPNIFYAANLAETRKLIDGKIQEGDIILIMGAGDIFKVADEMAKIKK